MTLLLDVHNGVRVDSTVQSTVVLLMKLKGSWIDLCKSDIDNIIISPQFFGSSHFISLLVVAGSRRLSQAIGL